MINFHSLDCLPIGKTGVVNKLMSEGVNRRRMLDLGIIEGTNIEALQKSPCGDPTSYYVRGTVIALRVEDAKNIIIKN
jgi:ferrous iron transport protein A